MRSAGRIAHDREEEMSRLDLDVLQRACLLRGASVDLTGVPSRTLSRLLAQRSSDVPDSDPMLPQRPADQAPLVDQQRQQQVLGSDAVEAKDVL